MDYIDCLVKKVIKRRNYRYSSE